MNDLLATVIAGTAYVGSAGTAGYLLGNTQKEKKRNAIIGAASVIPLAGLAMLFGKSSLAKRDKLYEDAKKLEQAVMDGSDDVAKKLYQQMRKTGSLKSKDNQAQVKSHLALAVVPVAAGMPFAAKLILKSDFNGFFEKDRWIAGREDAKKWSSEMGVNYKDFDHTVSPIQGIRSHFLKGDQGKIDKVFTGLYTGDSKKLEEFVFKHEVGHLKNHKNALVEGATYASYGAKLPTGIIGYALTRKGLKEHDDKYINAAAAVGFAPNAVRYGDEITATARAYNSMRKQYGAFEALRNGGGAGIAGNLTGYTASFAVPVLAPYLAKYFYNKKNK